MALADHHDGVHQEIVRFMTEARAIDVEIIELVYRAKGIDPTIIPPAALAFLITHTSIGVGP